MSPGFGALGFQSRKVHFSQFSYSRNLPLSGAVHTALGACNASGDAGKLTFTGQGHGLPRCRRGLARRGALRPALP